MLLAAATLQGTATTSDAPLPGCTITLQSESLKREAVTDAGGRYLVENVPPGEYELRFELSGLETEQRTVRLYEGDNVENAELPVQVIDCGLTIVHCLEEPPGTMFDAPLCADFNLDQTALEGIARGDRSAIALTQRRFETANTYVQKHKLAAALLRRVPDDTRYWNELYEHARKLVVAAPDREQQDDYWTSVDALRAIQADVRSRPLMLQALARTDYAIVVECITGLVQQRDPSALPAIERAIARFDDEGDRVLLAQVLSPWNSPAADRVAFRFLDELDRETYLELREAVDVKEDGKW